MIIATDETASPASEWRRQHRPGRPSRLNCDPELKAFVDANITGCTFEALAKAVRERFGQDRAVSKSTLARYWKAHKVRLLGTMRPNRG